MNSYNSRVLVQPTHAGAGNKNVIHMQIARIALMKWTVPVTKDLISNVMLAVA